MRPILALAATLALLTPALAQEPMPKDLIGTWEVTGVTVVDSPVQALVTDDPAYMGAVLEISKASLVWIKGTETRPIEPAYDNCDADPALDNMDTNLFVTCGSEPWGPGDTGGAFQVQSENEITLTWFDGGKLTLTRQ